MKLLIASLSIASIPLIACSSDPLAPGSGDQAGAGSKTLVIEGSASAEPKVSNAKLPTDFGTDFSVRITLNGTPITSGAMVTIESQSNKFTLTFNPNQGNGGRWEASEPSYDESYRLDIVDGNDKVTGVIVDGPDIHQITAPVSGASLDSSMPIDVKWDRSDTADICTLDVGHIDRLTIPDNGKYTLPANSLDAEKDKTKENTISIRRSNHVTPAGATGDSSFTVSVRNDLDVLALANPNLP